MIVDVEDVEGMETYRVRALKDIRTACILITPTLFELPILI